MVAFNERIQPRGVGRGVYLLDAENFAEMGEGGPKELWCIISDQVFWAREIADQVLQECTDDKMRLSRRKRHAYRPFGVCADDTQNIFVSSFCLIERSLKVDCNRVPWSRHRHNAREGGVVVP